MLLLHRFRIPTSVRRRRRFVGDPPSLRPLRRRPEERSKLASVSAVSVGTAATPFLSLVVLRSSQPPPPPLLALPQQQQQQQQQQFTRWMSTHSKSSKKDAADSVNSDRNDTAFAPGRVKLWVCYSKYDITPGHTDGDNEDEIITTNFNLRDIRAQIVEQLGPSNGTQLEYYDGTDWKKLNRLDDLQSYYESGTVISVRDPNLFDESDYNDVDGDDDEGEEKDYQDTSGGLFTGNGEEPYNSNSHYNVPIVSEMEQTIEGLVQRLKDSGYVRASHDSLLLHQSSRSQEDHGSATSTILTRDWVLTRAAHDRALRNLLLSNVCALDHIVQCLHYDMLWLDNHNTTTGDDPPSEHDAHHFSHDHEHNEHCSHHTHDDDDDKTTTKTNN